MKINIAIIIQQITLITAKMRRKILNKLMGCSCFCKLFEEERKSNEIRTHWPFKISTIWKFSNKDPGGLGGGRIVNKGGGGKRRKSSDFI